MFEAKCPHCGDSVIIEKLNCRIFRHGVYKATNKQIGAHSKKIRCDKLFEEGKIWGCGKPFKIIGTSGNYEAVICDYI